jgi:hypothetical protein
MVPMTNTIFFFFLVFSFPTKGIVNKEPFLYTALFTR